MFIYFGRSTGRIKKITEYAIGCENCGSSEIEVKVYRKYFHLFFVPVFPFGGKTSKIVCKSCGGYLRTETVHKHYEDASRTPFYFYLVPLLIAALIPLIIFANNNAQKNREMYMDNPKVGDVYSVKEAVNDSVYYYFLRVASIAHDSIYVYPNTLNYLSFTHKFNEQDYFDKDETLIFLHKDLKEMFETGVINSVERDYGNYEGFDRMK